MQLGEAWAVNHRVGGSSSDFTKLTKSLHQVVNPKLRDRGLDLKAPFTTIRVFSMPFASFQITQTVPEAVNTENMGHI